MVEFEKTKTVDNGDYYLFLDDYRVPSDVYVKNFEWVLVKNYSQFVECIKLNGLPNFISFDHDLADEHYGDYMFNEKGEIIGSNGYGSYVEKTGYDCAKWLVEFCEENKLKLPGFISHSMNPYGRKKINEYLNNAKKHLEL